MALALLACILSVPELAAAAPVPKVPGPGGVAVPTGKVTPRAVPPSRTAATWTPPAAAWPSAGAATVPVPAAVSSAPAAPSAAGGMVPAAGSGSGRPGGLPVSVGPADAVGSDAAARTAGEAQRSVGAVAPASVRVTVADQDLAGRAGIHGVVFGVSRADGASSDTRAKVELGYAAFKFGYGADYGGRLTVVSLPACVLATPERPECRMARPVPGARNDLGRQVVSVPALPVAGDVTAAAAAGQTLGNRSAAPMVFALTAGSASSGGDFRATDLSPAYSWTAGTPGGDFSTSYPIEVPPGLGGPVPSVSLDYSSGSVDARTHAENGQASWVGEGWELNTGGYIERSYRSCVDDNDQTGDLCWYTHPDNPTFNNDTVTMVLGGSSVRLIRDASSGVWKASTDSGLRVEKLNLTGWTNGDNDGEYWKVTGLDGTEYYFGTNKRYAADPQETKSVLTVPVFGTDPGEPCYTGTYATSWCSQAYRWNLDYVKDPRGNTMTYFYSEYIGNYGRNNNTAVSAYDLSAPLDRIEYGTRAGTEGASPAPMRVVFTKANRCFGACTSDADYVDTPLDKYCPTTATSCPNVTSPVFFTKYRLADITTQVRNQAAGQYRDVNHYQLAHSYPGNGDFVAPYDGQSDTNPNLYLETVTKVGHLPDGTTELAAPPTEFSGTPMENRVSWGDGIGPPYIHYRIEYIDNGMGGRTNVTYSDPQCPAGGFVPKFDANPNRCYSIKFSPEGSTAPGEWELFHKYVVTEVREVDNTDTTSVDEVWSYSYSAAASSEPTLWRHDHDETGKLEDRTWSEWLGYPQVTVTHGEGTGPKTVTTTLYHRGLDADARYTGDETARVWGARHASILSPLGVVGRTATLAGSGSRCFEPNGTANGSVVRAVTCTGAANQKWHRFEDDTLRHDATDKCLDPAGPTNGSAVQLWDCAPGNPADQQWRLQPDGTLKNLDSGRCVQIPGYATASATNLTIGDCTGGWNQVWTPTEAFGMANNQSQRCADLLNDGTTNGTQVVTWVCNNDPNQLWQQQSDNTWKNPVSNRCLDIVGSGTAAGTFVQLWDCTGAANQIWVPQADGTLKNPNSNRCLDTGANPATQQRLRIADCNASSVTQKWVAAVPDSDGLSGVAETRTIDGSTEIATSYQQYSVTQTASRNAPQSDGQPLKTLMTTQTATRGRAKKADGTWRWTETQLAYDSYGLPTQAKDFGDLSVATDDTCATISYARGVSASVYLVDFPSTVVQRVGTTCATGTRLGESHIYYDTLTTLGAPPTAGLVRKTETLVSQGTADVWATTETGYDSNGRVLSDKDTRGQTTSTAYTPSSGGPLLQTTVTNPLGHVTVTATDGHRGQPVTITDPNGKISSVTYDPLGRLTSARLPGHPATDPPDIEFVYATSASGSSVTVKQLGPNGNQMVSNQIYDGRLRPRQAQQPGPQANGGRVITDTVYDNRGQVTKASTFWTTGGPSATRVAFLDTAVPSQARTSYDNLERVTAAQLWSAGVMKWQTTTVYPGTDRFEVTPPASGIPTTSLTDAQGRTIELRQHLGATTSAAYQSTNYSYDNEGRLTAMSDPAGNVWTTTYDIGGRPIASTDPDKGAANFTYNPAGDLLTSTDTRPITLSYNYDILGRKTELWLGPVGTGTKRATWDYDILADGTSVKGRLVKSTRWVPNSGTAEAYSSEVTAVDDAYRPLSSKVTLPASMGSLAGPWITSTTYAPDGQKAIQTLPAAGSLPAETITYSYDNTGRPLTMASGLDTYISATTYHNWGDVYQRTLGTASRRVQLQTTIDEATRRLTENRVSTEDQTTPDTWVPQLIEQYGYDPTGNVRNINEVTASGTTVSNQCFAYDPLQRLTDAWTTTTATCQATPTQVVVGGPDPYWNSYTYDAIGNRTTDTVHTVGGNTVRTYSYPASGATSVRPHATTGVVVTGSNPGSDSYGYDSSGNTTSRNLAGKPGQALVWDPEGNLQSITDSGGTSSYVYTPDGDRLLAYEPGSVVTLYLGDFELRRTPTGVTCIRYYQDVAARTTTGGLVWLSADQHNTSQLSINSSTLAVTRRKFDPFGNPRGASPSWPTNRSFVNGTQDPTGLIHLGAREYEPSAGRFISVDPVLNPAWPGQQNPYVYSGNNPVTMSDPDGNYPCIDYCGSPDNKTAKRGASMSGTGQSIADTLGSFVRGVGEEASKAGRKLSKGATPEERRQAAKRLAKLRHNKFLRSLNRIGRSKIAGRFTKAMFILGFIIGAVSNFVDGDDPFTAIVKSAVVTAFSVAGAAIFAPLGEFCGPLAVICVPAAAAVGGYVGSFVGDLVNKALDSTLYKWTEAAWVETVKFADKAVRTVRRIIRSARNAVGTIVDSVKDAAEAANEAVDRIFGWSPGKQGYVRRIGA